MLQRRQRQLRFILSQTPDYDIYIEIRIHIHIRDPECLSPLIPLSYHKPLPCRSFFTTAGQPPAIQPRSRGSFVRFLLPAQFISNPAQPVRIRVACASAIVEIR